MFNRLSCGIFVIENPHSNKMSINGSIFRRPTIYYHALYWILNVLLFTMIFLNGKGNMSFLISLHENIAFLPFGMIFTYFSTNYLIPQFFFKNRIPLYITLQIIVLLLYPAFSNFVKTFYILPVIWDKTIPYDIYTNYHSAILILVFDIVPLAGVKILQHLRNDALLRQKTENDKANAELKLREAELKFLKSQIHPHFLFNTLNNLYSLALEKSDKTPDLIIKLADMLSYIIYDCSSEKVPLAKEIDFIKSFLELQRVRYSTCNISFKTEGNLNGKQIAPMILHTFIDNCFKHGADKDSGHPWISIAVKLNDSNLLFEAVNSTKAEDEHDAKLSGIGISNAQKRLDLLYPERHELIITNSENKYSVYLKLEL